MIVIGTDTHKQSHTAAALEEGTGRVIAEQTVHAKRRSFDDLLLWRRRLDTERVWAIEDCRHVSGALERFLLARGEKVVRVPPKLTAGARSSVRERGKSDAIDAVSIARGAIREGTGDASGRRARRAGARCSPARRPPRAPGHHAHTPDQRPALEPPRHVARA